MGRKRCESDPSRLSSLTPLFLAVATCIMAYFVLSMIFRTTTNGSLFLDVQRLEVNGSGSGLDRESGQCCRGIPNLELWGSAVNWGTDLKYNSSEECCKACKAMCSGNNGPCLCDSWVFCGDRLACGSKFGECWLKKQRDTLAPDRQGAGDKVTWTSGLVFGKGEGIVAMETEVGTLHVKLRPDCAPYSVNYILELLVQRHCAGCKFHRAEGRGSSWDAKGNHIKDASFGPPYALIQGTLEIQGTEFKYIPTEDCPPVRRGSVAWIDSGPEFFISLANHDEWKRAYTVFGSVLPEDMKIAEKIAQLPANSDVWNNISVSVLEKQVPLLIRRMKYSHGNVEQML